MQGMYKKTKDFSTQTVDIHPGKPTLKMTIVIPPSSCVSLNVSLMLIVGGIIEQRRNPNVSSAIKWFYPINSLKHFS